MLIPIAEPISKPAGVESLGTSFRCQWKTSPATHSSSAEYMTRLKSGSPHARRTAASTRTTIAARASIRSSASSPNDPWWNVGAIQVSNGEPAAQGSTATNPSLSSTRRSPAARSAAIRSS